MNPHQIHVDGQYIIYDAERLQRPHVHLFDPAAIRSSGCWLGYPAGGRGSAGYISVEGIPAVLRRYRRGGLVAPLLGDRYVWLGLAKTRPWREWYMLAHLYAQDLPVSAPIAARVQPQGVFYRADIVVEKIDAATLAERLSRGGLPLEQWHEIGRAVGLLHRIGVDHADLNAHNILVYEDIGRGARIIDFDRAKIRSPCRRWQLRNLARLQRSLRKLSRTVPGFVAPDHAVLEELLRGWSVGLVGGLKPSSNNS